MTSDDPAPKHVQWDAEKPTTNGPAKQTTSREDGPSKPSLLLTAIDGTETQLGDINKRVENPPPRLERVLTGLDNDDLSSVLKSISPGTLSEAQTTVNDHGDTAQLQEQNDKTQTEPPRPSESDFVGIGGAPGVRDETPETDSGLVVSDSGSEDGEDLWTSIDDRLISPPPNDGKQFLPLDELRKSISRPNVRRALRNLHVFSHDKVHKYANEVCDTTQIGSAQRTTRQRMFATLVIIDHIEALPSLISEELHDFHLPFELRREEGGSKWHLFYKPARDAAHVRFEGSCSWKNPKVKAFYEKQWLVLSPFFNMQAGKPLFHPLESMIILPFVEGGEGQQNTAYGGYSAVWRVKIHPAHHNYMQHMEPSFAIKKLNSGDKLAFERELHALKKFNRQRHQHLMRLLATYKHHGHWYFVFPWADGNLREFWQLYEKPLPNPSLVVWLAEQSAGIASGLELIQHPPTDTSLTVQDRRDFGRHGDLKPENVLWFRDSNQDKSLPGGGMLKIADFGLTRFHRDITKSDENARGLGVSLTYKAPEVDVVVSVSQSYDIWTLGCLLLEFVTWYLKGWEGVDEFSANRANDDEGNDIPLDTFYNVVSRQGVKGAVVKTSVRKWVQELHRHPDCSLFLHKLLTYTTHYLLRIGAKERHRCVDVVNTLQDMARRCKANSIFACQGCPKPPNKTDTTRTDRTDITVSDDGYNGPENYGFASPESSCHPSPELCAHGLVAEGDDFVELNELQDKESNSVSTNDHDRATNGTNWLGGIKQPTTMTVNDVQPMALGPETNSNADEGRVTSKRTWDEASDEDLSLEPKRPRLPEDETTLYGSDKSQKYASQ